MSLVSEVAGDGSTVYEVEIEVPSPQTTHSTNTFFSG